MSSFLSDLIARDSDRDEGGWFLDEPLRYWSDLLACEVEAPAGFYTDLASVPRVPIVYQIWGNRAHREAVIHDLLYRIGCRPGVSRSQANRVFLEAMKARGKPAWVCYPMYWGVCLGGATSWHKREVSWRPGGDT